MARMRRNDEIPRGALRAILLALLAERPAHGYALARALAERTNGALSLREGTLYPALHELEIEGHVEAEWSESPEGRKRRVYRLTRDGRKQAKAHREHWLEIAKLLESLLGGGKLQPA